MHARGTRGSRPSSSCKVFIATYKKFEDAGALSSHRSKSIAKVDKTTSWKHGRRRKHQGRYRNRVSWEKRSNSMDGQYHWTIALRTRENGPNFTTSFYNILTDKANIFVNYSVNYFSKWLQFFNKLSTRYINRITWTFRIANTIWHQKILNICFSLQIENEVNLTGSREYLELQIRFDIKQFKMFAWSGKLRQRQ